MSIVGGDPRTRALSAVGLCALFSCTVYDEAALQRKSARASARHSVQSDCGDGGCHASSQDAQDAQDTTDSSSPQPEPDATPKKAVQVRRTRAPLDASVDSSARDAGRRAPEAPKVDAAKADHADSSERAPVEAGADAATETGGFCGACDSAEPIDPVLDYAGGTGNVTTLGSVMAPAPSTGGACNYGVTSIQYFAAINANVQAGDALGQWQGGKLCGQCVAVRVKTTEGWKETVVRIVDKCSDPHCGIALGGAPARDLMGDLPGRYDGSWRFVSCLGHPETFDGAAAIHVKEGSSRWWALVHVRNATQAVTAIDWESVDGEGAGTFAYATEAENYFSVPEAVHNSGMVQLTIRYRDNTSATLNVAASQLATPGVAIILP